MSTDVNVSTSRPIRYGILDMLASIVLFGIHFGCLKTLLEEHAPFRDEEGARMAAAAVLCAAFAFGAAYLAFRFSTSKKVSSFPLRLVALVVIDAGLIVSPFALGIVIQALFEFRKKFVFTALPILLILGGILILWRSTR